MLISAARVVLNKIASLPTAKRPEREEARRDQRQESQTDSHLREDLWRFPANDQVPRIPPRNVAKQPAHGLCSTASSADPLALEAVGRGGPADGRLWRRETEADNGGDESGDRPQERRHSPEGGADPDFSPAQAGP